MIKYIVYSLLYISNANALDLNEAFEKGLKKDPIYISAFASYRAAYEKIPQAQAGFKPAINWVSNGSVSSNFSRNKSTNGDISELTQLIKGETKTTNHTDSNSTTASTNLNNSTTVNSSSSSSTHSDSTSTSNQNSIQNTETTGWNDVNQNSKNASISTGLVISMPLYKPILNEQLIQNTLIVKQAEIQLLAARQDLALRVSQAYFEAVVAYQNLSSVDSQRKVTKEQFYLAQKLYLSGLTTITDVHEAQARLDLLDAQDVTAQNEIKLKLLNLKSMIGPFTTSILNLKQNDLNLPTPAPNVIDFWVELARTNSYSSIKQKLNIEIAQSEINKQYAIYKPTLELTGNLGFSRDYIKTQGNKFGSSNQVASNQSQSNTTNQTNTTTSTDTTTTTGNTSNSSNTTTSSNQTTNNNVLNHTQSNTSTPRNWTRNDNKDFKASVGIQLIVPIYDGGLNDSRLRESYALLDKAQSDTEKVYADAVLATQQAYINTVGSLAQVKSFETAEKSSTLAMNSNQMGYQLGVRINVDVLNAKQQLVLIQRDLNRSRVEVLLNNIKLKASVGKLEDRDLLLANTALEK
ncbi:MAG: hypothetical protein RLZZ535_1488 [Cyanobacteriota bacterium]